MDKLDINGRFQRFRDSLIKDAYDLILSNGGKIDLHGVSIELKFPSVLYYNDVIGTVSGISLTASAKVPGKVTFKYMTPSWREDNSDYIDVGEEETDNEVALDEFSSNELYNILKTINI